MRDHDPRVRCDETDPTIEEGSHRTMLDRGASLVEYALLVALIAVACFTTLSYFGMENGGSINNSAERVSTAMNN